MHSNNQDEKVSTVQDGVPVVPEACCERDMVVHFSKIPLSMCDNVLACTVKTPVALQIGDVKTDTARPGVFVIDVAFPQSVNLQEISFKNYYTAFLNVRLQKVDPESPESGAQWVTCLRNHCLMPNPHTEEGSQDYFSIYRQQNSEKKSSSWFSNLTPVEQPMNLQAVSI
ncbi:UNVERIFIED_CONTAM: hypothetical protein FKN15_048304 [Acipenser sinensis]